MNRRRFLARLAAAVIAGTLAAGLHAAKPEGGDDSRRRGSGKSNGGNGRGGGFSADDAARMVREQTGGQVLSVVPSGGGPGYRVKVLVPGGRVKVLDVDAGRGD